VVTVQGKHHSHSRNSDTYYLKFPSWRAGHAQDEIVVARSFYDRVQPGRSHIRIVTGAGHYGYEWVAEYHLQP